MCRATDRPDQKKSRQFRLCPNAFYTVNYARQASESAAQATCREEKIELLEIAKAWVDLAEEIDHDRGTLTDRICH